VNKGPGHNKKIKLGSDISNFPNLVFIGKGGGTLIIFLLDGKLGNSKRLLGATRWCARMKNGWAKERPHDIYGSIIEGLLPL
jgi:hypothetical protein